MRAAVAADVRIRVDDGTAEDLPAEDDSFDAAMFSLVLCSVPIRRQRLSRPTGPALRRRAPPL